MDCTHNCNQGRDCDCDDDPCLTQLEALMTVGAYMASAIAVVALIAFLIGRFA